MKYLNEMLDFTLLARHTKYHDLIINCRDIKYYFHRHLLCDIPYFETCFDEKFKVNKDDNNLTVITFADEYGDVINIFLNIIYGKGFDFINLKDLKRLFKFLDFILCIDERFKILYNILCRLSVMNPVYSDENIHLALSYLYFCEHDVLIKMFDEIINKDVLLSTTQYCFLSVIFREHMGRKIYSYIKSEKMSKWDIEELRKYDPHNPVIHLFETKGRH